MKLEAYQITTWFHINSDWNFVSEINGCLRFQNYTLALEADFWPDAHQIHWYVIGNKFCGSTQLNEGTIEINGSCPNDELAAYIKAISQEIINET